MIQISFRRLKRNQKQQKEDRKKQQTPEAGISGSKDGEAESKVQRSPCHSCKAVDGNQHKNNYLKDISLCIKNLWPALWRCIRMWIKLWVHISDHSFLDCTVLNIPLYSIGAPGPIMQPFFLVYVCLCVFSWQLWFSSHRICCYLQTVKMCYL